MGRLTRTAEVPLDDAGWVPAIVLPGDECDQGGCPSAVAVSVTLLSGLVLGFCGHHGSVCYRQMLARGLEPRPLEKVC